MKPRFFIKFKAFLMIGLCIFGQINSSTWIKDYIDFYAQKQLEFQQRLSEYGGYAGRYAKIDYKAVYENLMNLKYTRLQDVFMLLSLFAGFGYGLKKVYSGYKEKLKEGKMSNLDKAKYFAGMGTLGLLSAGSAYLMLGSLKELIITAKAQQLAHQDWEQETARQTLAEEKKQKAFEEKLRKLNEEE